MVIQIGLLFNIMLFAIDVRAALVKNTSDRVEDAICGIWFTNNQNSKIEIFKKNGLYFGKIIWIKSPGKFDFTNKMVISDMTYNKTRQVWDRGTLYYPVKDTQYQGIIELSNTDTLSIRVFVGTPALGKTIRWVRAKM